MRIYKELDINVSEALRTALLQKVSAEKMERFKKQLHSASLVVKKMDTKLITKHIRETRLAR